MPGRVKAIGSKTTVDFTDYRDVLAEISTFDANVA